jgi:hypothetical protein
MSGVSPDVCFLGNAFSRRLKLQLRHGTLTSFAAQDDRVPAELYTLTALAFSMRS